MTQDELREMCRAVVKRNRATKTEKLVLETEAQERGIALNRQCPNCYVDAAAQIYASLPEPATESASERKWVLRKGVDVLFGGIRVNEATLTDELAERIVARGFCKMFFATYPKA